MKRLIELLTLRELLNITKELYIINFDCVDNLVLPQYYVSYEELGINLKLLEHYEDQMYHINQERWKELDTQTKLILENLPPTETL